MLERRPHPPTLKNCRIDCMDCNYVDENREKRFLCQFGSMSKGTEREQRFLGVCRREQRENEVLVPLRKTLSMMIDQRALRNEMCHCFQLPALLASVRGFYFTHSHSEYFAVGKIFTADQVSFIRTSQNRNKMAKLYIEVIESAAR